MTDYYALLGIEQKATKAEIKKNYRLLATKYHPDKNSDPKAASVFIAITEAYDTLSNRKSRARYDLKRWEALKSKQANAESFTTVTPARVSTRTRRNNAQQKRSTRYHQSNSKLKRSLLLIWESLCILCRYALHIMAITLMAVILTSAFSQIPAGLVTEITAVLSIFVLSVILLWCILKLTQNLFTEIKKDIALLSIYYKTTHTKAILVTVPVFLFVLIIYLTILRS